MRAHREVAEINVVEKFSRYPAQQVSNASVTSKRKVDSGFILDHL